MVDIHSHICYGVDDGSRSIEESLAMLKIALEGGTTDIVATPHSDLKFHFRPELAEMPDVPSKDFFRPRFQGASGDERIVDGAADHPHRRILGNGRKILLRRQGDWSEARLNIRDKQDGLARVPPLRKRHPRQG